MKNKILYGITGISLFLFILFMASAADFYRVTLSLIGAGICLVWIIPFFIINRKRVW